MNRTSQVTTDRPLLTIQFSQLRVKLVHGLCTPDLYMPNWIDWFQSEWTFYYYFFEALIPKWKFCIFFLYNIHCIRAIKMFKFKTNSDQFDYLSYQNIDVTSCADISIQPTKSIEFTSPLFIASMTKCCFFDSSFGSPSNIWAQFSCIYTAQRTNV